MKQILILAPYPEGVAAGQRLKYEQYFKFWKNDGYDIKVMSFFDMKTWDILHKKKFRKKVFRHNVWNS